MSSPDGGAIGGGKAVAGIGSDVAAEVTSGQVPGAAPAGEKPRSLSQDAWYDLRRNPIAVACAVVILIFVVMAIAPGLFTHTDPKAGELKHQFEGPSGSAPFGYDIAGRDVYSRAVHGARASILVGLLTTLAVAIVGCGLGMLAGFYGGKIDTVISRITDIFFGIPALLGSIIVLTSLPNGSPTSFWVPVGKVTLSLAVLGWPQVARLMRSVTLQVKEADYVAAARALGASTPRILRTHVLPNAVQPVIVYCTILFGAFIGAEASLSYLGIGLREPVVSWGISINESARPGYLKIAPHMFMFPALFLSLTVMSFILLGDAVRDALDPKQR
jgi:oligopeptide transport system permease protein